MRNARNPRWESLPVRCRGGEVHEEESAFVGNFRDGFHGVRVTRPQIFRLPVLDTDF